MVAGAGEEGCSTAKTPAPSSTSALSPSANVQHFRSGLLPEVWGAQESKNERGATGTLELPRGSKDINNGSTSGEVSEGGEELSHAQGARLRLVVCKGSQGRLPRATL